MGAFAKAQEQGSKVFETLVKEGISLQKKTHTLTPKNIPIDVGVHSEKVKSAKTGVSTSWDKLESIFEHRVQKVLANLEAPSRRDLVELQSRIDALAKIITADSAADFANPSVDESPSTI